MKKIWHVFEKLLGIYRWHPKIALRYLPVVNDIRKNYFDSYSILEVGSGGLGIAPYLKRKVIGLDIEYQNPYDPHLIPVIMPAENIPFPADSFSIVLCMDMLEHLPKEKRRFLIRELLRIAKTKLYIGVPCGRLAGQQDKELDTLYRTKRQSDYQFLSEQTFFGLPDEQEISDTIKDEAAKLNKSVEVQQQGNINLKFRKFLMTGWISQNFIINLIFRKLLIAFIPIMKHLNREPTYRKLFFVKIKYA